MADIIVSQQRFIATMLGRTTNFSTFSDAHFDEAAFEEKLTEARMPMMICWYWVVKVKARFLSGDYADALAAADKAKAIFWAAANHIHLLDYFYYTALTVAACYENVSAEEQNIWRDLLTAHREQLREWAENYPPTFGDKHALVSAEIARLEGRELDAKRLYEQAIRSARTNGFIHNEALAYELAARFYVTRGLEDFAHVYLRKARDGYLRWGADGKVRQLEKLYPQLRDEGPNACSNQHDRATAWTPRPRDGDEGVASRLAARSCLRNLIDTLMRTAIEQAGAERGSLIFRGDQPPDRGGSDDQRRYRHRAAAQTSR